MGQVIYPYGFTDDTLVTKLGIYLQGFGIASGVLAALFLTKYPKFIEAAAYAIVITTIASLALFYIATTQENETFLIAAVSCLGFSTLPTFFVAYELAVEQTVEDGVTESMSCGLINSGGMFLGFVVAFGLSPALGEKTESSVTITMIIMFAVMGAALVFLIFGTIAHKTKKKTHSHSLH